MMQALLFLPVIAGFVCWFIAVASVIRIVRMLPKGQKFEGYLDLALWRFNNVRAAAGPQVEPHLTRFKFAFLAFFGSIVLMIVLSVVATALTAGTQTASVTIPFFPASLRQET